MKNHKLIFGILIPVIILGFIVYLFYPKNKIISPINNPVQTDTPLTYINTDYGFTFSLPNNWKGYSIIKNNWEGSLLNNKTAKETGPKLLIRNPNWTSATPYEDIPIMIFTLEQWNSYMTENFNVSAAPIPASEIARNNLYVFALPPRWDFDYSKGFEDAENILKNNPMKVYNLEKISPLKNGRQCYAYNHEATKTEPYTVNEFIDMTVSGIKVNGTKKGNQKGPDMTNGYTGTLSGSLNADKINLIFSYIIEGSANKEKEIYQVKKDLTGIEKLRYPLIEKLGMLVPDTSKEFKTMLYARVGCEASN